MTTPGLKTSIFLHAFFSPQILDVRRQPSTSLLTAIAKIGGLFALLRFSILLNLWHQSLFDKKMNSGHQGAKVIGVVPASLNNSVIIDEASLVDEKEGEPVKDFREIFSHENMRKELEEIKAIGVQKE